MGEKEGECSRVRQSLNKVGGTGISREADYLLVKKKSKRVLGKRRRCDGCSATKGGGKNLQAESARQGRRAYLNTEKSGAKTAVEREGDVRLRTRRGGKSRLGFKSQIAVQK